MNLDDNIWPIVQQHKWKYQSGRTDVVGIIWHATRSGLAGRDAATEYNSTLNWFRSPHNYVPDSSGKPWYGGMSNYIIGGGKICLAVPEELVPRFSAGVHDFRAISVEVGQCLNGVPYDPRDIELCHELAAELSTRYDFPLGRIPYVSASNIGWPGEVGHEDTAQGVAQGKSDPGDQFWTQYLEDTMTADQLRRLERLEALVAGNGYGRDAEGNIALIGEEALEAAASDGGSLFLGLGDLQQAQRDHENTPTLLGGAHQD